MSAAGNPAAFNRAATASAAFVTLPAGVSVVLISILDPALSQQPDAFRMDVFQQ